MLSGTGIFITLESKMEINSNQCGEYGVLTIAIGRKSFIEEAITLAESLSLHSDHIPRAVITDSDDPRLSILFDQIIPYNTDYGDPLAQKEAIDLYTPFEKTIFVDADCMIMRPLDFVFTLCESYDVAYIGVAVDSGEWYDVNIRSFLDTTGYSFLPKLNTGFIYFQKSKNTTEIFKDIRHFRTVQQQYGFRVNRKVMLSDEPDFSMAFGKHGILPVLDTGRIMRTPISRTGPKRIDVLRGICEFEKENVMVRPAIFHFVSSRKMPYYKRERLKLKIYHTYGLPKLFGYIVSWAWWTFLWLLPRPRIWKKWNKW